MILAAILIDEQGHPVSFHGTVGVDFFRMRTLRSACKLLDKGIIPTRGFTKTKALVLISEYTGRKYKRTQWKQALSDLDQAVTAREQVLVSEGQVETRK